MASWSWPRPVRCGPFSRCASGRSSRGRRGSSNSMSFIAPDIDHPVDVRLQEAEHCRRPCGCAGRSGPGTSKPCRFPWRCCRGRRNSPGRRRPRAGSRRSPAPLRRGLRMSPVAASVCSTMASSSAVASLSWSLSPHSICISAISRLVFSIARFMAVSSTRSRSTSSISRSRLTTDSRRLIAPSSTRVSADRFRRANSARNQRPRGGLHDRLFDDLVFLIRKWCRRRRINHRASFSAP